MSAHTKGLNDRAFSALDRALVDYEPRRSLCDPAHDVLIRDLMPGARFHAYAEAPWFAALQALEGYAGSDGLANETARNALFNAQPLQRVWLSAEDLTFTQNVVNRDAIGHLCAGLDPMQAEPIFIVRYRGLDYVVDGHHRAVAAWLCDETDYPARVLTLED